MKNLGKFREIFQKDSRNTAEILEKYFKNFENYCGEFRKFFYKIILKIISVMFENHFKNFGIFRTFLRCNSENTEKYFLKKSFA